jgi:GntR family transcriptional regulator/MocR family aminotransferase
VDLYLSVDRRAGRPLRQQIVDGLRLAILEGRLRAGARLPSTRSLAAELGVARFTVEDAFDQLAADGYVEGKRGSGTFVAAVAAPAANGRRSSVSADPAAGDDPGPTERTWSAWAERLMAMDAPVEPPPPLPIDFRQGMPAVEPFPHERWAKLRNRARRELGNIGFHYGPAAGEPELRTAIAAYLARSRALRAAAARTVVTSGTQQGLDLLARLLIRPGDAVAFEEPGYPAVRRLFQAAGARIVPVPVDENGLVVAALDELGKGEAPPRIVYVTPSHQYPTGALMPLSRRLALLHWARRHGALVIEDDYDGEFRYGARPVEALAALDAALPGLGVVVYVGTFSKVLFPALRLGYLVLPSDLLAPVVAAKAVADRHSPRLEQRAVAELIESGDFERHLNRMRKLYAARRRALLDGLASDLAGIARRDPATTAAGLHLLVTFDLPIAEAEIVRRAAGAGVHLDPAGPCYLSPPPRPTVMIGYASVPEQSIREGVRRLAGVLVRTEDRGPRTEDRGRGLST